MSFTFTNTFFLSLGIMCIILQRHNSVQCALSGSEGTSNGVERMRVPLLGLLPRVAHKIRNRFSPGDSQNNMADDFSLDEEDTIEFNKRQSEDYGHMRFGKRGDQFEDYGHMRFGRSSPTRNNN